MVVGDLVRFTDVCGAIIDERETPQQLPIWPAHIDAGEVGLLLKIDFFEEVGHLCEVLIGQSVFLDVPALKIEKLFTSSAERN